MRRSNVLAIPLLLLCSIAASAQGIVTGTTMTGPGLASGLKGMPFSADVVTEHTRVLQDGNHIRQVTHGKMFRDSEGRTRKESGLNMENSGQEEFRQIIIHDTVQEVLVFFNTSGDKTATVHHVRTTVVPPQVTPARSSRPAGQASSDTEVCRLTAGLQNPPGTQELAPKTIEGFTVRGTRHTRIIEAGKIGNEKPLVTTIDSWYSDELQEVLMSETDDPLSGHTSVTVTNIQRSEPDPALFQVPPGFTVKED